jgi:endoglucanase
MLSMKKLLLFLSLFIVLSNAFAQTLAHRRNDQLEKGLNLSNWMEAYWMGSSWPQPNLYDRAFLAEMKVAGFKSVRMPVCFALVTDTVPPYAVDTASPVFAQIDSVIKWTHELDMNLIIDNHHLWDLSDATFRNVTPRLAHLWSVLAQKYSYLDPDKYYFEILNEPSNIANDSVNILMQTVVDTIRKYTSAHTIVVGPAFWSGGFGFRDYKSLADTNLIYTLHSYDPFPFTHQGFTWANPYNPTGRPFPNSGYDFAIGLEFGWATHWRDSTGLPLFLGEFGVGRYADDASRCNWIDTIGGLIDQQHLPSFSWDVRWDFYLFKSDVESRDSIVPCFGEALHLYGMSDVRDVESKTDMQVYPNPASKNFNCTTNNGEMTLLEVFNAWGQKVYSATFMSHCQVNSAAWPRGIYLLKATGKKSLVVSKVVLD